MPNPTPPKDPRLGDDRTPKPAIAPKGLLSNFAPTPFKIDGVHFGSVEAFVQCIKYPPDSPSRAAINKLEHGPEAKRQGREANRWIDKAIRQDKVALVYWASKTIPFGSPDHHKLIGRAIRAKFKVTPDAREALLETGDAELKIDHRERANTSLPGKIFCKILESLRAEIRGNPWAWTGGKSEASSAQAFASSLRQFCATVVPGREGSAGQIRSGDALTNSQVVSEINKQVPGISTSDIVQLVRGFPISERRAVMECLYAASRYSNLNGLNRLHLVIERVAGRQRAIYAPGTTTLGDSLQFLQDRRLFKNFKKLKFDSDIRPDCAVILDDPVLRQIENDSRFAKTLIKNRAILINIEGYESGIGMFSCHNSSDLRRTIIPIYLGASKFLRDSEGQMSFSDAVAAKLNDTVHRRLTRAEEIHELGGKLFERVVTVAPTRHLEPMLKLFDGELNDRSLLNESRLAKILRGQTDPDAARELIVQTMQVFSLRRLGEIAQKLHRRIQSELSDSPFSHEDIRFLVVIPEKVSPS